MGISMHIRAEYLKNLGHNIGMQDILFFLDQRGLERQTLSEIMRTCDLLGRNQTSAGMISRFVEELIQQAPVSSEAMNLLLDLVQTCFKKSLFFPANSFTS